MLAMVAAANIKKVQIKKYSDFIYSEAEPHAMYAIYKQTHNIVCSTVLQPPDVVESNDRERCREFLWSRFRRKRLSLWVIVFGNPSRLMKFIYSVIHSQVFDITASRCRVK